MESRLVSCKEHWNEISDPKLGEPILVPEAWTSHSAFVGLSSPIWNMWAFISMGTCNSNGPCLSESSQKGANLAECRQVPGLAFSCASYPELSRILLLIHVIR